MGEIHHHRQCHDRRLPPLPRDNSSQLPRMRRFAVLALAIAGTTHAAAAELKGVKSSDAQKYLTPVSSSRPGSWKCLNSSQEIPLSAVNDNYCDCEDGTDEPGAYWLLVPSLAHLNICNVEGTSACPTGQFYCANKGHIGVYIRASRVNDGLCEAECCDGSDEAPGICPDVCHVVGEEYRRATEADRKLRKTGSKIRSTYISFAQKEKLRLEESVLSLELEVEAKLQDELKARGTL